MGDVNEKLVLTEAASNHQHKGRALPHWRVCIKASLPAPVKELGAESINPWLFARNATDIHNQSNGNAFLKHVKLILEGEIEIYDGNYVIAVLEQGQLFGEMAVLGGGRRTASGRAKDAARLLFLKDKAIRLLIQQVPDIAFALFVKKTVSGSFSSRTGSLFFASE